MTGVFIKRGSVGTDMHFGEKRKAVIKVALLQAKERPKLPENHQELELEKHRTDSPSKPLEGTHPTNRAWDFQPPECETGH